MPTVLLTFAILVVQSASATCGGFCGLGTQCVEDRCVPVAVAECCDPSRDCLITDVKECVCAFDAFCCASDWDMQCVDEAVDRCDLVCPLVEEAWTQLEFESRLLDKNSYCAAFLDSRTARHRRSSGVSQRIDTNNDNQITLAELTAAIEDDVIKLVEAGYRYPTPSPNAQPNDPQENGGQKKYCPLSGGSGADFSSAGQELYCETTNSCPTDEYPPVITSDSRSVRQPGSSLSDGTLVLEAGQGAAFPKWLTGSGPYDGELNTAYPWFACYNSFGAYHGWWNANKDYMRIDLRLYDQSDCGLSFPTVEAVGIALEAVAKNKLLLKRDSPINKDLKNITNLPDLTNYSNSENEHTNIKAIKPISTATCSDATSEGGEWVPESVLNCFQNMINQVQQQGETYRFSQTVSLQANDGQTCVRLPSVTHNGASTRAPTPSSNECYCYDPSICPQGKPDAPACQNNVCTTVPCPKPPPPPPTYLKVDTTLVACEAGANFTAEVCSDASCGDCQPVVFPSGNACTTANVEAFGGLVQSAKATCGPKRKEVPTADFKPIQSLLPTNCWDTFQQCTYEASNLRPGSAKVNIELFVASPLEDNTNCAPGPYGIAADLVRQTAEYYSQQVAHFQDMYQQAVNVPGLSLKVQQHLQTIYDVAWPKEASSVVPSTQIQAPKDMLHALLSIDQAQVWPDPQNPLNSQTACTKNPNTFTSGRTQKTVKVGTCIKVEYDACVPTPAPTQDNNVNCPTCTPPPTSAPTVPVVPFDRPKQWVRVPECNFFRNITAYLCNSEQACNNGETSGDCTEHTFPNSWYYNSGITVQWSNPVEGVDVPLQGQYLPWSKQNYAATCTPFEKVGNPWQDPGSGAIMFGCAPEMMHTY